MIGEVSRSMLKAEREMNMLGSERRPFFFLFDFLLEQPIVLPLAEWNHQGCLLQFGKLQAGMRVAGEVLPCIEFHKFPMSFDAYREKFELAHRQILFGNSYLLNLTQPTIVTTNYSLRQIFEASVAPFKLCWHDQFVVFSPERFVRIEHDRIYTHPMKGTISASVPDAERSIIENKKEIAESYTIVDLLRNDLNMVAKRVRVDRFRYLSEVMTDQGKLLQVSSEVSGQMKSGWQSEVGTIMCRLVPAGSVSGAPKRKTVEIILATEGYDRGYYTGVFGYFDGNDLDSAVAIRFIEDVGQGQLVFKSGGGLTALSDAEQEYRELIQKVYVPIDRDYLYTEWQTSKFGMASGAHGKELKRSI